MAVVSQNVVAECFWPDVRDQDMHELDERIRASAAGREDVRYLGSLLIRSDDVVLCRFEGTLAAVRALAEHARIPFERLLETTTLVQEGSSDGA